MVFKYLDRLLEETKKELNEEVEKVRKREPLGLSLFLLPQLPFGSETMLKRTFEL